MKKDNLEVNRKIENNKNKGVFVMKLNSKNFSLDSVEFDKDGQLVAGDLPEWSSFRSYEEPDDSIEDMTVTELMYNGIAKCFCYIGANDDLLLMKDRIVSLMQDRTKCWCSGGYVSSFDLVSEDIGYSCPDVTSILASMLCCLFGDGPNSFISNEKGAVEFLDILYAMSMV